MKKEGAGETIGSPVLSPEAKEVNQIIFVRAPSRGTSLAPYGAIHLLRLPKIPRPACPWGTLTSDAAKGVPAEAQRSGFGGERKNKRSGVRFRQKRKRTECSLF